MGFDVANAEAAFTDREVGIRLERLVDEFVADVVSHARSCAEGHEVPVGLVTLHALDQAVQRLCDHREISAGWALAVSPRTAVAKAVGRSSPGSLETLFPKLGKIRDIFRRRGTGEDVRIEHGSVRWNAEDVPRNEAWSPRRGRLVSRPDFPLGVGVRKQGRTVRLREPKGPGSRDAKLERLGIVLSADGTPHWARDVGELPRSPQVRPALRPSEAAPSGVEWKAGGSWGEVPASDELRQLHERLAKVTSELHRRPLPEPDRLRDLIATQRRLSQPLLALRDRELARHGIELENGIPKYRER